MTSFKANGQNSYLPFTKEKAYTSGTKAPDNIMPIRDVNTSQNSTTITYQFRGGMVADALGMDKNNYEFIHVEGFGKMTETGKPALPAHNDIIATPGNGKATIEIISSEFIEYEGYVIHPAFPPMSTSSSNDKVEFAKDEKTYTSNKFFPDNTVEISEMLEYRGNYFSSVRICPVQYNPVTKTIRVYSEITYRISYQGGKKNLKNGSGILNDVVLNRQALQSPVNHKSSYEGKDPAYLIIARSDYSESANMLARWKSQLGYRTEVILKERWESTEVKEAIHSRFASYTPAPSYFVIIGDHEQVPAEIYFHNTSGETLEYASDLYYACTGGPDDYFPDMAKGRISANSPEQAVMMVKKGIDYEKNPVNDESFYKNGLSCAQFQDVQYTEAPDGFAARRFCMTSENIRDYMVSLGYDMERIYYTDSANTPTNYNNGYYSNGEKIPDELLKENGFDWDGDRYDIIREINKGKFFVIHNDHGYSKSLGWVHPNFRTPDIYELNNKNKLPLIFSMNCHSGEFLIGNSFAEALTRYQNGGAVGVVGAANLSYSGFNDALAIGMVNSIWSDGINPAFGFGGNDPFISLPGRKNNIRTMGDVLNQGLIRMREVWGDAASRYRYTHRLYHFFGDPALKMWTSKPGIITASYAASMPCGETSFNITEISIDSGTVTLVQGDSLIAKSEFTSNTASLSFQSLNDSLPVVLTVSAPGYRPLTREITLTGCSNTPIADFSASRQNVVNTSDSLFKIYFVNNTTYRASSYKWTISPATFEYTDGTDKSSVSPSLVFNQPGTYSVSLEASNENGSNTITKKDYIHVVSIHSASCKPKTQELYYNTRGIYHLRFGDFTKRSGCSVSDHDGKNGAYMDFTSEIISLKKGHNAQYEIEVGEYSNESVVMFIDYNNDGEFDTITEKVSEMAPFKLKSTGELLVKESPAHDFVRLRVISDQSKYHITGGCYGPKYGQVEDYTVKFIDAEPVIEIIRAHSFDFNSALVDAEIVTNGDVEISDLGIIYTTDTTQPLSKWTIAKSPSTDRKFTQQLTSLDDNTVYYAKAYAENSIGRAYSKTTVEFLTYSSVAPTNHITDLQLTEKTSSFIRLNFTNSQGGVLPYGYIAKWSTAGFNDITVPQNGSVETGSGPVTIIPYGSNEILVDSLKDATTYFIKIYPYVNDGERIKYKTDGTIPQIEVRIPAYGEYPPVSFTAPNTMNYVRFNTLFNSGKRKRTSYKDFRSTHGTDVRPDESYNLIVGTEPGNTWYRVRAWADWNQDGKFDDTEHYYLGLLPGKLINEPEPEECPDSHSYECGGKCYADSAQAASDGCFVRTKRKLARTCPDSHPYECQGECYTDSAQAASSGCLTKVDSSACPSSHPYECNGQCYTDSAQAVASGCLSPVTEDCPASHPYECNGNCYIDSTQAAMAGCHKLSELQTVKVALPIQVPASAKQGWTTLRVVYTTDPAIISSPNSQYGTVEDYRIVVDNNSKVPGLWQGTISSNWNEPGNWDDNKVPGKHTTVQIYKNAQNSPEINAGAFAGNLFLEGNGKLTVQSGDAKLDIVENLYVNDSGLFVLENGEVSVAGYLNLGNRKQGSIEMKNGVLNVTNDIYTSNNTSNFNMSGGTINAISWRRNRSILEAMGNISLSGGELNLINFIIFWNSNFKMSGNPVVNVKGLLCTSTWKSSFTGGTYVLKGGGGIRATSIGLGNFGAYNLVIEDSTSVYFTHPGQVHGIDIFGDFTVNGTANFIGYGLPASGGSFKGNVKVGQNGHFVASNAAYNFSKDLLIDGNLLAGNSSFTLSGTEAQNIRSENDINTLIISNTHGASMTGNVSIGNKLTLSNSPLRLNGQALTLRQNAVIENAGALSYPDVIISEKSGEIRKVINQEATSLYLPLGNNADYLPVEAEISEVTPSDKYISFSMMNNTHGLFGDKEALQRAWEIRTEEGFGNFKLDATLLYTDADLGNLDENDISPVIYAEDAFVPVGTLIPEENKLSVSTSETGIYTAATPSNKKGKSSIDGSYTNKNGISVYPNPSNGKFSIFLENQSAGEIHIRITNAAGQLIASYKESNTKNPEVDLSGVKKGLYYIELISNEFNTVEKVILK